MMQNVGKMPSSGRGRHDLAAHARLSRTFLKLVEIIRNADVSIANLEFLFHDYESPRQWTRKFHTPLGSQKSQRAEMDGV